MAALAAALGGVTLVAGNGSRRDATVDRHLAHQNARKLAGCFTPLRGAPEGVFRLVHQRRAAASRTLCMAAPKRVAMVGKQLEREIGTMLLTDTLLQEAVCPDRKRGQDAYLTALASVTEVDISRDLQVAKVYISVYSDDEGRERAFAGLKKLEGYVRKHIGQRIRLRMTPEIRFIPDDSFDRSQRVLSLLKKIGDGDSQPPPIAIPAEYDGDEWEEEGEEYVVEDGDELITQGMSESERRAVSDAAMREFLGGQAGNSSMASNMFSSNKPSPTGKGRGGKKKRK